MAEARTTHCKRCKATGLFWAQSSKTGKWYLCNAMTVGIHVNKPVPCPWSPHKCDAWKALTVNGAEVKAAVSAYRATPTADRSEARAVLLSAIHAANPGANGADVEAAALQLTRPANASA
jgi:hypothetical protein